MSDPMTASLPKPGSLVERAPLMLEAGSDDGYALLDSGGGRKLEKFGPLTVIRPEGQAIWQPARPDSYWQGADAIFTGDTDEEGIGRWRFPKNPLGETWPLQWDGIDYLGRFTSFRHVGVFPEQAAHWRFVQERLAQAKGARLLNLFAYTGVASLVAARAGAQVTHVDASKKAIAWARENQEIAGMNGLPIRWICEDATKFCEREKRRGNTYDAILLDPPSYGRGPKGEVWRLFEDLPKLLDITRQLLAPRPLFVVLTAYSIRASFLVLHELMRANFAARGGELESGELTIATQGGGPRLSTSLFSRWIAPR
jgi:23S rRNA (cytosine1962-C5)-methyltransferase